MALKSSNQKLVEQGDFLLGQNHILAQIADNESYIETIDRAKFDTKVTPENKSVFDTYSQAQLDAILRADIGTNVEGANVTEVLKDQVRKYNKSKKVVLARYKVRILKDHFTKDGTPKDIPVKKLPWAYPRSSTSGLRNESQGDPVLPKGTFVYLSKTGTQYWIEKISVNTLCEFLTGNDADLENIGGSGFDTKDAKYQVPKTSIDYNGKEIAKCSEIPTVAVKSEDDKTVSEGDEDLDFATWCSKQGGTSALDGTTQAMTDIRDTIENFQESLKEGGDNPLREIYDDIEKAQEDMEEDIEELREALEKPIKKISEDIAALLTRTKKNILRKSNLGFNIWKSTTPSAADKTVSEMQQIASKAITCIFKLLISSLFNMVLKAVLSFINKIINVVDCVIEEFISQFIGQLIGQLSALLNSIFGPISNLFGKGLDLLSSVASLLEDILNIIDCEVEVCTVTEGGTKVKYWNMINGGKPNTGMISLTDIFNKAKEVGEAWEAVTNVPENISDYQFDFNPSDTLNDIWEKCDPGPLFCGVPKVTFWGSGDGKGNGALGNSVINAEGEIVGVDVTNTGQWSEGDYEAYVNGTTETYIDFDDPCDNGKGGWGEVIVGPITGIGEVGVGTIGGVDGDVGDLDDPTYPGDGGQGTTAGVGITYYVTVHGTSLGDKFFIDDKQQLTLTFERGNTYILDQEDVTNFGHPLRFSETKGGTWEGGVEYTRGVTIDGIPGLGESATDAAYSRMVVNNNTPDTLYYYCENHPKMGGIINIVGGDEDVVSNGAGRNATIEISAVNAKGGVVAFRNLVGGSGYNECSINVVTIGGNGTRFTVDIMKTFNTTISALAVNNKGSGYAIGDIVTITSKVAKNIIKPTGYGVQKVLIMESGYGYLPAPDGSQGGSHRTWAGRCQTTVRRANGDWDYPFDENDLITLSLGDCVRLPSKPVVCIDEDFDTSKLPGSTIITGQYVPKDMSNFPLSTTLTGGSDDIITDFSKITLIDEKFNWQKLDDPVIIVPEGQYGIERIDGSDPRVQVKKWNEQTQQNEFDPANTPIALWNFYADGEFIGRFIQTDIIQVPQFYQDGILYRIGTRQFDFELPDFTIDQMPWVRAETILPANNWVLTTGWSPFLKNYGVYPSPADPTYSVIGSHTATWKVNTLLTGTYTLEMQADNIGTISWDGVELASTEAFSGHNKFVISNAYAGEEYGLNVHTITASIQNIPHEGRTAADYTSILENPGAIAWVLRDPRGIVIKTSLDPFETQFEEISFSTYFNIKMYSVETITDVLPGDTSEWFGCVKDLNKAKLLGFSDCDIRHFLENNPDIQLDQCMQDKLNDPNWGNCSSLAVSLTAPGCPSNPCIPDNTYPVIACLDDIYVDLAGFGYDCCNDTVSIVPDNGAQAVIEECDGGIKKIRVTRCGAGFTTLPEVTINTNTGYNSVLKPILKFHKPEEVDVPEGTNVLQVIDCVGHVGNSVRTKVNG